MDESFYTLHFFKKILRTASVELFIKSRKNTQATKELSFHIPYTTVVLLCLAFNCVFA